MELYPHNATCDECGSKGKGSYLGVSKAYLPFQHRVYFFDEPLFIKS